MPKLKPSKIRVSARLLILLPLLLALVFLYTSILHTHHISISLFDEAGPPTAILREGKDTAARGLDETSSVTIPPCNRAPWKSLENLVGSCPGALKPHSRNSSVYQCASDCCADDNCITWQYRADTGCLHGGDVRLGMEKDGVSSWCSDHPPQRWQGQYVLKRAGGKIVQDAAQTGACSVETWNPAEQPGQCFGLGDVRKEGGESAKSCMEACCRDVNCGAWQWQPTLGCFYNKRMHGCVDASDPIVFEAFVGRRKVQPQRSYTDKRGDPWRQTNPEITT